MKIAIKLTLSIILFSITQSLVNGQIDQSSCLHESILARNLKSNPHIESDLEVTEQRLNKIIQQHGDHSFQKNLDTFLIPVVLHVFHNGDDGKIDMEQVLSGLKVLNEDFNGLNDGWKTVSEPFDSVKSKMNILFIPATIDPYGNPTNGILYHENESAMLNQFEQSDYAWDNFKYLNIYLPKYTKGAPSDFTAYAYYPNLNNVENNGDGIVYSSIRWGYGSQSELTKGDNWTSIITHEVGHWLNLYHTFHNACLEPGDFVDDTPPAENQGLQLSGCTGTDMSCGQPTNGENFMDYNHRCKKMFTKGQVERMTAALYLPSRVNLWSEENLITTGLIDTITKEIKTTVDNVTNVRCNIYPNPAQDWLIVDADEFPEQVDIYTIQGELVKSAMNKQLRIGLTDLKTGLYIYTIRFPEGIKTGKFLIAR